MGQKDGEKWTAAVDLQPTIPKSDRLLQGWLLDRDSWTLSVGASPTCLDRSLIGSPKSDFVIGRNLTVSIWLARLRKELGDPLFVRTAGGMLPTPRTSVPGCSETPWISPVVRHESFLA